MGNIFLNNLILDNKFFSKSWVWRKLLFGRKVKNKFFFLFFSVVCISSGNHCPGRRHLCQPQWLRAKERASESSKRPWWGGRVLIPDQFTGHVFSPHQKSFGFIRQDNSLNFWCLGCMRVCGGNASQGGEHQWPQEHPAAFSISFSPTNLFLPIPGGKAVTFFF